MSHTTAIIAGERLASTLRRLNHQACYEQYCYFESARVSVQHFPDHVFRMSEPWFSHLCVVNYEHLLACCLFKMQPLFTSEKQAVQLIQDLHDSHRHELEELKASAREMPKDDDMVNADMRRRLLIAAATAEPLEKLCPQIRIINAVLNRGLDPMIDEMPTLIAQVCRNTPDPAKKTRLYRIALHSFWRTYEKAFQHKGDEYWRDVITRHWHKWLQCWKKSLDDHDKNLTQIINR